MSVPRRHHLLPQFYMRSFANSRGQVRVIERSTGHEFTATTANVFVERDFYMVSSVDADDDPALIEGLYSQVETIAAPIFARVSASEFPLGGQDRSELATFMALQVTRGRQFREFMDRSTETLGRAMLQGAAQAPPSYWRRQRAEWEAIRKAQNHPRRFPRSSARDGSPETSASRSRRRVNTSSR